MLLQLLLDQCQLFIIISLQLLLAFSLRDAHSRAKIGSWGLGVQELVGFERVEDLVDFALSACILVLVPLVSSLVVDHDFRNHAELLLVK